jgi:hypothetical protein
MKSIFLILIVSLLSTQVKASLVTWDIKFFNDSGAHVGAGDFSYDPATTDTYIYYDLDASGSEAVPIEFEINTSFINLDWTVLGVNWLNEKGVWWNGSNNHNGGIDPPGAEIFDTLGSFTIGNFLYFAPLEGQYLNLDFDPDSTSPNGISTASGSWIQGGDFSGAGSGTWSAQVSTVPIPSVFLLFGSGLISMVLFGRKSTRKIK